MIKVQNLHKKYGNGRQALKDVSFEIKQGEFVYCVGPSGSGKSTLLKALSKEIQTTSGLIQMNQYRVDLIPSRHLYLLRRQIGIVSQEDLLIPQVNVYQNISIALKAIGTPKKEIRDKIERVLSLVQMGSFEKSLPEELSIGQRKKISIARSLVNQPSILLVDEPTANLDGNASVDMMKLFLKIHQTGTTILLATHDSTMVNSIRYRVLELNDGQLIRDDAKGGYSRYTDPKDIYIW
ncbi:MAG TPA: ATP-binding cassette domain-containing protein [Candidatus Enterococcus avicola]|uniref:ATP-binding cassette domain-containing protein n=1 Tax=Candidatus Enterococcus avicola TaxID=2838561 RepID=A0A9D2JGX2_9ENTE|nr:ATP-binding cassette domain-containing protein [Candidatus Enterococcus avicola]